MLAGRVDQQVPDSVVDEYAGPIVQQVPADEVKIASLGRFVERQCEIMATLRRAMVAEVLSVGVIRPAFTNCGCLQHRLDRGFITLAGEFKLCEA